ncbi:MAG TPA: branched-chain amino acid aminotransferase [Eubacteriales bacterium]|nr:branched-chain amino acid aminotransferase [Clostridia bacterium]HRV73380.1 branched-chain amino acid aminotransferase [Eubacteriales bacterium]
MNISVETSRLPMPKPEDDSKLGFGKVFTDHMFLMDYDAAENWHDPRIVPFQGITLHPAATALHYGQEIFEGMKAYRGVDGKLRLFRPDENAKRLNASAERLCMPTIPVEDQLQVYRAIADMEREWAPSRIGTALYLRPTMIGTGQEIGVHPSSRYLFFVICCSVGSYFKGGLTPVDIYVEDKYVRAVRGGLGVAKTGGNYAASLKASHEASSSGYAQVLWLDGVERRYIEEVGAMNIMFIIDGKLVTPELSGSILPGITRKSVIELARDMGLTVEERKVDIDEVMQAGRDGRLTEAFGTGTAAVISPVGSLLYKGEEVVINNRAIGSFAQQFYDEIVGMQFGKVADKHGWTVELQQ